MTPADARKVNMSASFLYHYIAGDEEGLVPTAEQFVELTDGNFRLADAVASMLGEVRGETFDAILDNLEERDEQFPDDPAATPMWATTVDMLKYVHSNAWKQFPQPSSSYDLPTAFRSSFNLAVAAVYEFASETGKSPAEVASTMAEAAAREM